jgi:hypothetical protein
MRHIVAALVVATLVITSCWGANLRVDASKTVKPQSLQLKKLNTEKNSFLQQKRYSANRLKFGRSRYQGIKKTPSINKASDSISKLSQASTSIGQKNSMSQPRLLDQVIKSSDAFEKAYHEALTLELSKRAAAQVEKSKIKKKKVSQRDINRDAKARLGNEEGFRIQRSVEKIK